MKKLLITTFILISSITLSFSQDVITKKNGEEIKAKITEVSTTEIRYKLFDNQSGPTIVLLKSEVFMIKYEIGRKEIFNEEPKAIAPAVATPAANNNLLYDAGQQLVKFKNHYYTGIGLMAGGTVVQIVGTYTAYNSRNSNGYGTILLAGALQLGGLIFILESFSHAGKAGQIMMGGNQYGFGFNKSGIGFSYSFGSSSKHAKNYN